MGLQKVRETYYKQRERHERVNIDWITGASHKHPSRWWRFSNIPDPPALHPLHPLVLISGNIPTIAVPIV